MKNEQFTSKQFSNKENWNWFVLLGCIYEKFVTSLYLDVGVLNNLNVFIFSVEVGQIYQQFQTLKSHLYTLWLCHKLTSKTLITNHKTYCIRVTTTPHALDWSFVSLLILFLAENSGRNKINKLGLSCAKLSSSWDWTLI